MRRSFTPSLMVAALILYLSAVICTAINFIKTSVEQDKHLVETKQTIVDRYAPNCDVDDITVWRTSAEDGYAYEYRITTGWFGQNYYSVEILDSDIAESIDQYIDMWTTTANALGCFLSAALLPLMAVGILEFCRHRGI